MTLAAELNVDTWSDPAELLYRLRTAITTYRRHLLPHLTAEIDLVLPALVDEDADDLVDSHARLLLNELTQTVDQLVTTETDLLQHGPTGEIRIRATALLTAANALSTVATRFSTEILHPRMTDRLSPHEIEQLTTAVHAYENSIPTEP